MRKSIIYLLAAAGLAVMPGCSDDPIPNPGTVTGRRNTRHTERP